MTIIIVIIIIVSIIIIQQSKLSKHANKQKAIMHEKYTKIIRIPSTVVRRVLSKKTATIRIKSIPT